MIVKSNAPRLIVIRSKSGKSFEIIPGINATVDLPDDVVEMPFVQLLLDQGSIVEVFSRPKQAAKQRAPEPEQKINPEPEDDTDQDEVSQADEAEEIKSQLESLGVKADKRWGLARLHAELQAAKDRQD